MMDVRPETSSSSGRFRGQWAFLSIDSQHAQQPRSLPPSSYILHSDRSSASPLPTGLSYHIVNGSHSSFARNLTTAASIAGRSGASTIPSQPVLIRVHSADASAHTNPAPRPRRPINMSKGNGLPAISEFSIQGILTAIQEDVEQDINTISDILGRSRLVLADQHESQMPPLGEIRASAPYTLQAVEEVSPTDEQFGVDDVFILRDDASLIAESYTGSAAYGLLERLQAMPRLSHTAVDWSAAPGGQLGPSRSPNRQNASPTGMTLNSTHSELSSISHAEPFYNTRNLLQLSSSTAAFNNHPPTSRTTPAIVSETHLLAEADGTLTMSNHMRHHHHHHHPHHHTIHHPLHYAFDATIDEQPEESERETTSDPTENHANNTTFRDRMQNLLYVSDPTGLSMWLQGQSQPRNSDGRSAASHLRGLLERTSQ